MPLFKVDIEKVYLGEYWTNVYYVEAADIAGAAADMDDIEGLEQDVLSEEVTITKGRATPVPNPGNAFITHEYNESGAYVNSSPLMPLFNTVRIDMGVGSGRPSRKFLRGILHMDALDAAGDITGTVQSFIFDNYASRLLGLGFLSDESGNTIEDVTIFGKPSDRQLRRGSRRRTTPVLP